MPEVIISMEQQIHFARMDSPIGPLLLADAGSGLCSVLFASKDGSPDRSALLARLDRRYGSFTLVESLDRLAQAVSYLEDYFIAPAASGPYQGKLAPGGTEFQRRVWNWLIRIPAGEAASYSEVANRVGRPQASRAVGSACRANPLPIFIPCHRVIGKTGLLTGFGGGLELKARLLKEESWAGPG